jgi:phosphonate transport system substrate-binding protein
MIWKNYSQLLNIGIRREYNFPMVRILVLLFMVFFSFSGCKGKEPATPERKTALSDEKPLLIGLIPERNIFDQMQRYRPLADYVSKRIGRDIKLTVLPRYGNIIDNFVSSEMDGAFFGSFTYTLAHGKLGVEVLARPENFSGDSTYHGYIFVRKDGGIRTAKDMKGKVFVFVDRATTAGYLLPLAYFKRNNIENFRTHLKETYFSGTHEDAIYDVLNRKADIGAAKNTEFERIAAGDRRIEEELLILERSPDVPDNGLAVRRDLEEPLKEKIREVLLDMHNDSAGIRTLKGFGARRFLKTTDEDYSGVYGYIRRAGLDIATYNYIND